MIRNLHPAITELLRVRASQQRLPARNLYKRIRARFDPLGGADNLELPPRLPDRDPPRFD